MDDFKLETACDSILSLIPSSKDLSEKDNLIREAAYLIFAKVSYPNQAEYWNSGVRNLIEMILAFVATDEDTVNAGKNNLRYFRDILLSLKNNKPIPNLISCAGSRERADKFYLMTPRTQKMIAEEIAVRLDEILIAEL